MIVIVAVIVCNRDGIATIDGTPAGDIAVRCSLNSLAIKFQCPSSRDGRYTRRRCVALRRQILETRVCDKVCDKDIHCYARELAVVECLLKPYAHLGKLLCTCVAAAKQILGLHYNVTVGTCSSVVTVVCKVALMLYKNRCKLSIYIYGCLYLSKQGCQVKYCVVYCLRLAVIVHGVFLKCSLNLFQYGVLHSFVHIVGELRGVVLENGKCVFLYVAKFLNAEVVKLEPSVTTIGVTIVTACLGNVAVCTEAECQIAVIYVGIYSNRRQQTVGYFLCLSSKCQYLLWIEA